MRSYELSELASLAELALERQMPARKFGNRPSSEATPAKVAKQIPMDTTPAKIATPVPMDTTPAKIATPELPPVALPDGMTWEAYAESAKLALKAISTAARTARKGASREVSSAEHLALVQTHVGALRDAILALPSSAGKVIRALSVRLSPETGEPEIKSLRVSKPRG